MNTAMNDHLAQFVKGAHTMTAAAVLVLLAAAIPTNAVFLKLPSSPVQTRIVGPVTVTTSELPGCRSDVGTSSGTSEDELVDLKEKVAALDAKVA
jgi:hypothetical protein